jgi:predicted dehydrogenase
LVGAGAIARAHARIACTHPDLELVAVTGRSAGRAQALAADVVDEFRAQRPGVFDSLEVALRTQDIDLVVITTPSGTHAELAEIAIEAGRHVLIEKPVDVRLDRARRLAALADAAGKAGTVVSVVSQHRFSAPVTAVRTAIDAGRFGRITSATATVAWWRDQTYYDSGEWRGTWQLDGGGALMNQGVHTVDLLLHLLGTPVEVFGWTGLLAHTGIEVEDVAAAVVRFDSGALATLLATTNAFPENSTRIQVHGTAGSAYVQDGRLEYFHADDAHPPGQPRGSDRRGDQSALEVGARDLPRWAGEPALPEGPSGSDLLGPLRRQYDDVLHAVRTGREPVVTVTDAMRALGLVRAVYVSQTLGTAARFADVLAGAHDDVVVATGR